MSRRSFFRTGFMSLFAAAFPLSVASGRGQGGADDISDLKDRLSALEENFRKQQTSSPPNVPIGTILSYAGPVDATHPLTEGWRQCDGSAVRATDFGELWTKLRVPQGGGFRGAWGGDGNPNFNLPDLRGRFLRGVDSGANLDPGRALGTPQDQSFKSHKHTAAGETTGMPLSIRGRNLPETEMKDGLGGGGNYVDGGIHGVSRAPIGIRVWMDPDGGAETRPVNSAVHWIIRVK